MISSMDIRDRMSKTLLFKYVPHSLRDEILDASDILTCHEGDVVVKEGEPANHVFVVLQGQVSATVSDEDGTDTYLSTIGEGEIFGEAGIFLKTSRTANIVSLGSSEVLRVERDILLGFIKQDPSVGIKVLMIVIYGLLKKLRESNQELAYERHGDVIQEDIDDLVASLMEEG